MRQDAECEHTRTCSGRVPRDGLHWADAAKYGLLRLMQ